MNEITKYQNRMNTVNFTGFGKVDSNLFFAICTKMKNKGTNKAAFSFAEIRQLANYSGSAIAPFVRDLEASYNKLLDLKIKVGDDEEFVMFNLFNYFEVSTARQTVEVACNEHFEEILNDWTGEWTAFRLEEYVALKSTYSKHMYRLLKQWRVVGGHAWKMDELRLLLEVPSGYDITNFNKRVLKPIMDELPPYFVGLAVEKIKGGKGNKIIALRFTFKPEDMDYGDYTEQIDTKNKAEKSADLRRKQAAAKAAGNHEDAARFGNLADNIDGERTWMKDHGIADVGAEGGKKDKKPSLFARFFGRV